MRSLAALTALLASLMSLAGSASAKIDFSKLDVSKLDASRFIDSDAHIGRRAAASTTLSPTTSTNFVCDNCDAYNNLIQVCVATLTITATTTLNDIQLPLFQCLCKQPTFYQVFGNCESGCLSQPIKTSTAFAQQCQLIQAGKATITPDPSLNVPAQSYLSALTVAVGTGIRPVFSKNPSATTYSLIQYTIPAVINRTLYGATATMPASGSPLANNAAISRAVVMTLVAVAVAVGMGLVW
ncbi:hypothetical protein BC938DRAFT_480786 [Jimgerdemannia flammicorona]|uniref:Uncharacterized protein n=1 Tax=Jimgerdemannia flammicorona TaxID=994334 RepID=A0A433QHQ8_9FUNG|nr:hypothetical protein BC938DRAFT_480786 [Jimgerdemannia flammicorona]